MEELRYLREMDDRELRICRRSLRHRRERRRRLKAAALLLMAALCLAVLFAASYSVISTKAGNGFKYYTQITVEPGDTLWDIAGVYMDGNAYRDRSSYIAEVRSINHLDEEETIQAGRRLIVPYYSAEYK